MAEHAPPTNDGSLDQLKRVKDAETEWEERLRSARAAAEEAVKRAREEADGRIGLAKTAAHQSREERLRAAQQEGDREAARLLAAGEADANAVLEGKGKRPSELRTPILKAVLGEFLADGSA